MRVKFQKGNQRKFLEKVLLLTGSPSSKELANRIQISHSTLRNYFSEFRKIPESLFRDLCYLAKISVNEFDVEFLENNWGQIKGGRVGKR